MGFTSFLSISFNLFHILICLKILLLLVHNLGGFHPTHAMIWHRKAQEHLEAEAQAKMKIQELREAAKKHKQWYKEQLDRERESSRDTETNLNKAMARLEGLHGQEANLWQEIKTRYELKANASASKIQHLKSALDELKAKTDMGSERIRAFIHSYKD